MRAITEKGMAGLKPARGRPTIYWDRGRDRVPGFGVRVFPSGRRAFVLSYTADRRRRLVTLGDWSDSFKVEDAREDARAKRSALKDGVDPLERRVEQRRDAEVEAGRTVGAVVERFLEQHASRLRGHDEVKRTFDRYVLPRWRDRQVASITRGEVADLLDDVAEGRCEWEVTSEDGQTKVRRQRRGGDQQADRVLAWLSKMFNWWAARNDDFRSPIVRGMRRVQPKKVARHRVLSDAEVRALWKATDDPTPYNAMVRTVLLTAQRPGTGGRGGEVVAMRRSEVKDGVWEIPAERSKTGVPLHVPLSDMAREVVDSVPVVEVDGEPSDLVFTLDGRRPIGGFSKYKRALDERMAEALGEDGHKFEPWRTHDCRRTARVLMARAGVPDRHAEMLLGHVIAGVEGVYNRHSYEREKREAADALAAMVRRVLAGESADVLPMRRGRRGGRRG